MRSFTSFALVTCGPPARAALGEGELSALADPSFRD